MIAAIVPVYQESPQLIQSLIEHLSGYKNISQVVIAATKQDSNLKDLKSLFANNADQSRIRLLVTESFGRAVQMNAGANSVDEGCLLFVHSDTCLPDDADQLIINALNTHQWGRFDVQLDDNGFSYKIISWFMNKRSRLTGISTGDQAIFCHRDIFRQLGGFPNQALMEDVEFCKRAKKISPPVFIDSTVVTSARRWQKNGVVKTILLMWGLRALYWFGIKPDKLALMYRQIR